MASLWLGLGLHLAAEDVQPGVDQHVGAVLEALGAVRAHVRLLVLVHRLLVLGEGGGLGKGLVAVFTRVWLGARVDPLVGGEVGGGGEGLAAGPALVRSLPRVDPLVHQYLRRPLEHLPAEHARQRVDVLAGGGGGRGGGLLGGRDGGSGVHGAWCVCVCVCV